MFEVVVLKFGSEFSRVDYDGLLPFVSLEKQERIKRFAFFGDALNCLLGDVLARVELCRITGLSNCELVFAVNSCGKPFLVNNSNVYYNISHVGNCIACVVGDVSVGVDVELVKPIDVKIVERFFMPDEQKYILSSTGDLRNMRFFEVWTKKESRIKCEGKGLFESLTSFSVFDSLDKSGVFYHCIYNNDGLIGHVCSSKEELLPLVRVIDINLLLQYVCLFK